MLNDVIRPKKKLLNSEHMGAYVKVGDNNIHFYEEGEGEPLLLIHSVGQSLFTWHRCITALSQEFHVFAIDLLGHGYSDKPDSEDYSVDRMSELIVHFMDALEIQSAHILGFSVGAIYSLRAVQTYPDRFGRLVMISPGGVTPSMPFFVRALNSPALGWLFQLMINPRTIKNLLNECFFDQTLVTDEMVREYFNPIGSKEGRSIVGQALRSFDEEETMQAMRNVKNDTLIVWGVDDRWHEVDIAEQFHVSMRGAQFALIRNCGHMVHEEKVARFIQYTNSFLHSGDSGAEQD